MRIHIKKPITLFNKGVVIDLEAGFYHVKGAASADVISFVGAEPFSVPADKKQEDFSQKKVKK